MEDIQLVQVHFEKYRFLNLFQLNQTPKNIGIKLRKHYDDPVNDKLNQPIISEFDDLLRLHYIAISRKVTTILEFGVGKSTLVFCDALERNSKDYFEFTSNNLGTNLSLMR